MLRTVPRRSHDEGFTLIEVVVAVVLMALVFASVSVFFVQGIATATGLQRRDAGVQVGDQALDFVRAVPSQNPVGTTKLLANRSQAAVTAQWADAPAELSTTTPAFDAVGRATPAVDTTCFRRQTPAPGEPLVPLRSTCTVGGIAYTVDTFIGTCLQPAGASACTNARGVVGVRLYRVVVRVTWSEGADTSCSGQPCQYLLTTLVNSDGDLVFNSTADEVLPVAQERSAVTPYQTDVRIQLVIGGSGLRPAPVTITTAPSNGTFVGLTTGGSVVYRPNRGFSGYDEFRYTVTTTSDRTSTPARVLVTVLPAPAP